MPYPPMADCARPSLASRIMSATLRLCSDADRLAHATQIELSVYRSWPWHLAHGLPT